MPFPCALERQTQMVFNDTGDVASYFSVRKPLKLQALSPEKKLLKQTSQIKQSQSIFLPKAVIGAKEYANFFVNVIAYVCNIEHKKYQYKSIF